MRLGDLNHSLRSSSLLPMSGSSLLANPGVKPPRKQKFRRFAEVMQMFQIHIHPGSIHRERRQNSSPPVQNNRSNSFRRLHETPLSYLLIGLIVLGGCVVLSGCGGLVANTTGASAGSFTASPATIAFGSVAVGSPATNTVSLVNSSSDPVVISQLSLSNSSFSVDGAGTLPFTLAAKSNATLNVHFGPSTAGAASGQLVITSNSLSSPSTTVQLSGTGVAAPALSGLSCASTSVTGSGTDACTVTLAAVAPSGSIAVGLASNNAAVSVPTSVTVAANATTAGFTATVSAVTSAQTATLTSSENGTNETFALSSSPAAAPSGAALTVNASSIAFGNVAVSTPSTQSLTLSSTGSAPITVSAASISGTGFAV